MDRGFCLELAASGARMPIGTDLVLHEQLDPAATMLDGEALGKVMEEAAHRYRIPLAIPLMDLRLEKWDLLSLLGVDAVDADQFHFTRPPSESDLHEVRDACLDQAPFSRRNQAHINSVAYIARCTSLVPVGMAIGPFSLMTKLMQDPITAVAMSALEVSGEDDASVLTAERCLELAELAVRRSICAQVRAGAKAVLVCEPAANRVYISPRHIDAGSDVFERFVMQPGLRLKAVLEQAGAGLIFHDCGELTTTMVREFATRLHPLILSLGSSRKLWEDAAVVPKDVVLYGNLPTKNFYSDFVVPLEKVPEMACEIIHKMRDAGHPHILGSECDVLHVPEAAATIRQKVDRMMSCKC